MLDRIIFKLNEEYFVYIFYDRRKGKDSFESIFTMNEKKCEGKLVQGIKSSPKVVRVFFLAGTQLVTVALPRTTLEEHFSTPVQVLFRSENEISAGSPFYTVTYPPET